MRLSLYSLCISTAAAALPASASTLLPDFTSATFVPAAPIDNTYFPVRPDYVTALSGSGVDEDGEAFSERSELSFAGVGRTILGVETTQIRDRAYEDGLLVEDTFDYFAQDTDGNVWYLGEDVTNYVYDDDDNLVSTNAESAWIAGENDALPGYIMPADPVEGLTYFQEFAEADEALDMAQIWETGATVTAGDTTYSDVLVTLETNPFEPDAREFKYYAPGVGIVRVDEGLDETFGNPELVLTREGTPAPVPVPPAFPLMAAAVAALVALRRRRG